MSVEQPPQFERIEPEATRRPVSTELAQKIVSADYIAGEGSQWTTVIKDLAGSLLDERAKHQRLHERSNALLGEIREALGKATPGPWEADRRFQAIRDAKEADWLADVAWEGDLTLLVLLRNNVEALLEAVEYPHSVGCDHPYA